MNYEIFNSSRKDSPFLSLSCLLFGIIILSFQDALIKYFSSHTSFWQLQFIRSIFNITFLLLIVFLINKKSLILPKNWYPVYFRAFVMVLCMFCFFSASPFLNISQMAAGLYTFPLFVTILSVIISREVIGLWRVLALFVGTTGALLVLEPWNTNFKLIQLLPVCAGFFYACNIILIRKFCRHESPLSLTFAVGILFFISGFLGIITFEYLFKIDQFIPNTFVSVGWPDLTLYVFIFCLFCSILNVVGNLSLSKAYQNAESSWLAPLDYSYLLFACIWSKLIFEIWPTKINLIGLSFIAIAGIITAYREKIKENK